MIDRFSGKYHFLSNFHPQHSITVEHIFQAMKTTDPLEQVWILSAPTATEAKKRGRQATLRPDWEDIKFSVMEMALTLKFQQDGLREALIATGEDELVEGNTWGDRFWGVDGTGENHLGKLLMKIREKFDRSASV